MSRPTLRWYAHRLGRMSAGEIAWRTRDQALRTFWASRQVRPGERTRRPLRLQGSRRFGAVLPSHAAADVPDAARKAVVNAADDVLAGRLDVLGVPRTDLRDPDWFTDPVTGRRSDPAKYSFAIQHRSEEEVGNVKQVWELSRHHHLTLLAAAWYVTGDDKYALRVAEHLRSWWRSNPFLSGVHWTSGIEVGIRLVSWVWVRRLLHRWSGVTELFDHDDEALEQLRWHQQYLATFRSRGSSANNHVIAEAAGLLVASSALPWFAESRRWRTESAALLGRELQRNTFPDGLNRELASDYHRFVAELGLLGAVEADLAGAPLRQATWDGLTAMLDTAAAVVDQAGRPPRQGDGDDGRVLALEPADETWSSLLAFGAAVVCPRPWWPAAQPDLRSTLVSSLVQLPRTPAGRPRASRRPAHFPDAGATFLRTVDAAPEIWCRCDGGPHGFLGIAAHAHADALSVELRVGGVDVLADPGTYCYHGEPAWRSYFRSTVGHNTVELAGRDQSVSGGPFLWLRHATGLVDDADVADDAETVWWRAEHDGYRDLDPQARHRRTVRLDRRRRRLDITDEVDVEPPGQALRMAYHLGPDVAVDLVGNVAYLQWCAEQGEGSARLDLPPSLSWTVHYGEVDPVVGWYSPRFGRRVPAFTLIGSCTHVPTAALHTGIQVDPPR